MTYTYYDYDEKYGTYIMPDGTLFNVDRYTGVAHAGGFVIPFFMSYANPDKDDIRFSSKEEMLQNLINWKNALTTKKYNHVYAPARKMRLALVKYLIDVYRSKYTIWDIYNGYVDLSYTTGIKDNTEKILTTANMMTGCEIVLPKLNEKFELIIVTDRNDVELEYAKEKLNAIGLSNIKIYSNEHKKIDRFKEENVDYIIDDDENICINASKNNIYGLYFKNNASNRVEENKYLINVNNWGEIYKFIMLNNY